MAALNTPVGSSTCVIQAAIVVYCKRQALVPQQQWRREVFLMEDQGGRIPLPACATVDAGESSGFFHRRGMDVDHRERAIAAASSMPAIGPTVRGSGSW